jgi:16S rRNA pseudouridine516 synthase
MRLDKFLVSQNIGTRKEVQKLIKSGEVTLDGKVVKKPDTKIDENVNKVQVNGNNVDYMEYVYIVMNKPKGYISASNDKNAVTVIDLVPEEIKRKNLFPAGRLDKDTTGLMIITDDGDFAHKMLSPKHHVDKRYLAVLDGEVTAEMVKNFKQGIKFYDGTLCLSATLIPHIDNKKVAEVVIREGKYHQVKKMFLTQGLTVLELKRLQIGEFVLPKDLSEGESRLMSDEEIRQIFL